MKDKIKIIIFILLIMDIGLLLKILITPILIILNLDQKLNLVLVTKKSLYH